MCEYKDKPLDAMLFLPKHLSPEDKEILRRAEPLVKKSYFSIMYNTDASSATFFPEETACAIRRPEEIKAYFDRKFSCDT